MGKLQEIISGWYNDQFPTAEIITMATPRAEICACCMMNENGWCDNRSKGEVLKDFSYHGQIRKQGELHFGCGCKISKKTKSPTSICPLGKWLNVIL